MKKQEVMNKYKISAATLRNWQKINSNFDLKNIDEHMILKIVKGKKTIRRNKKNSKEYQLPISYIKDKKVLQCVEEILNYQKECQLSLKQVLFLAIKTILEEKQKKIPKDVKKVLGDFQKEEIIAKFPKISTSFFENHDFLGCLYMSLLSVGKKDTNGIFYTPFSLVEKSLDTLSLTDEKKVFDPGCGSGIFLNCICRKMKELKIPDDKIVELLYGVDIDPIAVLLAKINLYLLFDAIDYEAIHISCCDFLKAKISMKYDIIIGNPPWGKKYSSKEKEQLTKKHDSAFAKSDSFSQFIFQSFSLLKENGILSFVLPSSILNIKTHEAIRKYLLNYTLLKIDRVGRSFEEIVTDILILQVKNKTYQEELFDYNGVQIKQTEFLKTPSHNFLLEKDEIASRILEKIMKVPAFYLKEGVTYGLGIVTGNNKKYLLEKQIPGSEPIISGKNLSKYRFHYDDINSYIVFDKDKFQQVAPVSFYRYKKKILYKFIGHKLCFCTEEKGYLSLNSANVINIKNEYDINYIVAILNSRLIQLFFDTTYDTPKVLRHHIESFPIFKIPHSEQEKIIQLLNESCPKKGYHEEIEDRLYHLVHLTEEEICYLKDRYS